MALDSDLVRTVETARTQLDTAEQYVLLARGEYHAAIRRLHLAGAPVREIAEAIGISHQRIQQIVTQSGGTWWTRVWGSRRIKRDTVCTWCERPPSEVAKLIAGPNVYICDRCVDAVERVFLGAPSGSGLRMVTSGTRTVCTFCTRRVAHDRPMVAGQDANICSECLQACSSILAERAL